MGLNELILNKEKTVNKEFSLFCKQPEEAQRFLGLYLDSKLSWKYHVQKLESQLAKIIYVIKKLREELPLEALKSAYYGLFHSRMVYGIELWGGSTDAPNIFKLQKKVIRTMLKKRRRDSCKPLFTELQIMTLFSVFIYRLALKQKENKNKTIRSMQHLYNTRNKTNIDLPRRRLVKSDKIPSIISAKIYNHIPEVVRTLDVKKFKLVLNNFLLQNCFYSLEQFFEVDWNLDSLKLN